MGKIRFHATTGPVFKMKISNIKLLKNFGSNEVCQCLCLCTALETVYGRKQCKWMVIA